VVGFCYGGGMVNFLATKLPDLAAGVPFYGNAAPADQAVARIKAELLLVFAENDERINAAWPAYEAALRKAGVRHEALTRARTTGHAARLQQRHHAALRRGGSAQAVHHWPGSCNAPARAAATMWCCSRP
jgi:dienelactone hydrolase